MIANNKAIPLPGAMAPDTAHVYSGCSTHVHGGRVCIEDRRDVNCMYVCVCSIIIAAAAAATVAAVAFAAARFSAAGEVHTHIRGNCVVLLCCIVPWWYCISLWLSRRRGGPASECLLYN